MLLVHTYLDKSPIHGIGLFAAESIEPGRPIWRFVPGFDLTIAPEVLDNLPVPVRLQILRYGVSCPLTKGHLVSSDDDRFTNHSETPNTRLYCGCTYAIRFIEIGDEITVNYRDFGEALPADSIP